MVNGVNNPLCISMADAMATKLKPPVWEKQVELDIFVCAGKFNHFHRLTLHLHIPTPPPLFSFPPSSFPSCHLPPTYTHTAQWSWCTKAACTDTSDLAPYLAPHTEALDHAALLPWTPICSTFPGLHCCLSGENEQGQSNIT